MDDVIGVRDQANATKALENRPHSFHDVGDEIFRADGKNQAVFENIGEIAAPADSPFTLPYHVPDKR